MSTCKSGKVVQTNGATSPTRIREEPSFLSNRHEYHLYCYDDVGDVPSGAQIRDANEILPASEIFCYQRGPGRGSVAAFSNVFRYKLLLERGGWWADMDVVCLRPFTFSAPVVFASEHAQGGVKISNAVMKLPAGHRVAADCHEAASKADRNTLAWGETGPDLLTRSVEKAGLTNMVMKPDVFCPIAWWNWAAVPADDDRPARSQLTHLTYAVHLWHEMWRRHGLDPRQPVAAGSLFAQWLAQYAPGQAR